MPARISELLLTLAAIDKLSAGAISVSAVRERRGNHSWESSPRERKIIEGQP